MSSHVGSFEDDSLLAWTPPTFDSDALISTRKTNVALGLNHLHGSPNFGSVRQIFVERFFHHISDVGCFYIDVLKTGICVIGLAPSHPFLNSVSSDFSKVTISYDIQQRGKSTKTNLLSVKLTGKRKRGAIYLKRTDTVCQLRILNNEKEKSNNKEEGRGEKKKKKEKRRR